MTQLAIRVASQPDETTCGPTCLHAVYSYFGDDISLAEVLQETEALEEGGTLAVMLGCHALGRGYRATLYSFNLTVFDPTWFTADDVDLVAKLEEQCRAKNVPKLLTASTAYANFVRLGGSVRMEDLTDELMHAWLERGRPLLVGVSATYLYGCARELPEGHFDDIRGVPQGHFVVLAGHRPGEFYVCDPWGHQVGAPARHYWAPSERLRTSILLGVLTYDGTLLIIEPG